MDEFVINGGHKLRGEINISGAKNAAVAILPATILAGGRCVLENVPNIKDVVSMAAILRDMGATVVNRSPNMWIIDSTSISSHVVSYDLTKKLRASYYLLGALLGRFSKAEVAMPGGCNFGGSRPIDLHLKGFSALGANVVTENGMIRAEADRLKGSAIYFDKVSVGATMNVMLAAVTAKGETRIENAAREPHIVDLANFLNLCGADIMGAGTDVIRIKGVDKLHGCNYSIIPDQIEAGTYMVAAAATRGHVKLNNVIPKHLESITAKLRDCGVNVSEDDDSVTVWVDGPLHGCNIKTMPHPGFPTDMQPQMTVLLSLCGGTSIVADSIWENRFRYVDQLSCMGAQIQIEGKAAIVQGVPHLTGAPVRADDLRAGAALLIAGLAAEGRTVIEDIVHIDRGYEDVVEKLTAVGADIRRCPVPGSETVISQVS